MKSTVVPRRPVSDLVVCTQLGGTVDATEKPAVLEGEDDWIVTVKILVPACGGRDALGQVGAAIGQAGLSLVHGSKYDARLRNPKKVIRDRKRDARDRKALP